MAKKYLDETGLAYFWSKIKAYVDSHSGGGGGGSVLDYYPVGSYYETSDSNFNPNTSWGGTWVLETEGRVHIGAGSNYTIGSTGGATTHKHTTGNFTLLAKHLPAHTHGNKSLTGTFRIRRWGSSGYMIPSAKGIVDSEDYTSGAYPAASTSTSSVNYQKISIDASHTHTSVGGDTAHNHGDTGNGSNMQPYIVVNRWHRTA